MWAVSAASYLHPPSEIEKESVQELSWDLCSGSMHPKIRRIVPMVLETY